MIFEWVWTPMRKHYVQIKQLHTDYTLDSHFVSDWFKKKNHSESYYCFLNVSESLSLVNTSFRFISMTPRGHFFRYIFHLTNLLKHWKWEVPVW